MALLALEGTNARIQEKDHHLAYFNTRTGAPDTPFKGMQKTATWYALRNFCIPAFGIESSKNIKSNELKILYHNYVVNEFMKQMEVIPENPPIYVIPAVLEHALITVNGDTQYVTDGDVVKINKDDTVAVKHIEANHTTGVSCDILGFGNLNDLNKEIPIGYTTKIVFRKEDKKFADVTLEVQKSKTTPQTVTVNTATVGYVFELVIDGETVLMNAGGTLNLKEGQIMKINRLLLNGNDTKLSINLRGWVPEGVVNNDGDDRGYNVQISSKVMIKRYSIGGKGAKYPVTVDFDGRELARMYIIIDER